MGISSKPLTVHFFCFVQAPFGRPQLAQLRVSEGTVWSDLEQLIQVRFRGQGITLIHSSCCVVQITVCSTWCHCLELISDGFELSPVSVLQRAGAQCSPRFRKVGMQSHRLAPLALRLLSAAFLLERGAELVVPHSIP